LSGNILEYKSIYMMFN